MKEIKSIKLCFENVEVIEVPIKCVASFMLDKIHKTIIKDWHSDNSHKFKIAKSVAIILKPEGNIPIDGGNAKTLFERIQKFNDLASIDIVYENKSKEIYFNWNTKDEYSNRYQSSFLTKNGFLIVVIDKKKRAKDMQDIAK